MPYEEGTSRSITIGSFKGDDALINSVVTFVPSSKNQQQQHVLLNRIIVVILISILSLDFTSMIVHAQYAITSYPNRYFAGTFILSFNASLPISVGTSPFSDTNMNTSAVYNPLIKYSAKEMSKVVIITGTSSMGDYLIFTSPTQFNVDFDITIGFDTLTFGKRTVYIPSYGFQRFYTHKHVRKGKHNNLVIMSGNVNQQVGGSQTINVGYTFNMTEPVNLTPYTLSTLNYKMLEIVVPSNVDELDEDHYVPFYLQIQCVETDLCRLVINLFNVEDDAPYLGTAFGIVLASFAFCVFLTFLAIVGSIIHRRRRGVPILAFIEPQKIQTLNTVQYYSPTMQPLSNNGSTQATFIAQPASVVTSNYFTAEPGVVVYQPPEQTQIIMSSTSQDVHHYDSKV